MANDPDTSGVTMVCSAGIFPWWLILLWGILTLAIGMMFLTAPEITTVFLITLMGAYWLVGGIFSLGSLAVDRTNAGMKIFLGIINIIAGALIMIYPIFSTLFVLSFFVIFIGFFACFIGCSHLYAAYRNRDPGNGVLAIISLIFGILLLLFPLITVAIIPFVIGGFCLISGISGIIASFMAKKAGNLQAPA